MSGPNLALEIARGLPASSSSPPRTRRSAARLGDLIGTRSFRLYRNRDVIGVELCGALKNIIAIAAGAADGLGFGDNGKAGLHHARPGRDDAPGHRGRRQPADFRRPGRASAT